MIPVTPYGAIFAANGCRLNFSSKAGALYVVDIPKVKEKIVKDALSDISKFDDTSNYMDGMAAIHLADFIDELPTPLSGDIRTNVLTALGILKNFKYVSQVLAQQKTNRSWHGSDKPGECTSFGSLCTHRGITVVPGKRGRKSSRSPDQYHRLNSSGEISREQLVTPALEAFVSSISADVLISSIASSDIAIKLEKMSEEELEEVLSKIALLKQNFNGVKV